MATDVSAALLAYLKTRSDVTDVVGTGDNARILPDVPKQDSPLQFIVYVEVAGQSVETLSGGAGLATTTMHLYAYGATRTAANSLQDILRAELQGYQGAMGDVDNVCVTHIAYRDTGVDLADDRSHQHRYWTRGIYELWHDQD